MHWINLVAYCTYCCFN